MTTPAEAPGISRRRVVQGVAWATPAIVLAVGTPPAAASGPAVTQEWREQVGAASVNGVTGSDLFSGATVTSGAAQVQTNDWLYTGFYRQATFGSGNPVNTTWNGTPVSMSGNGGNGEFIGNDFRTAYEGRFLSWSNANGSPTTVTAYYALNLGAGQYRFSTVIGTGLSGGVYQAVSVDVVADATAGASSLVNVAKVATRAGVAGYTHQQTASPFFTQAGTGYASAPITLGAGIYYVRMTFTLAPSSVNDDIWVNLPTVERLVSLDKDGEEVT